MVLERKDYYYHGTTDDVDQLISILKNGIISRNKLKKLNNSYLKDYIGFNGNDYVSICKKVYPTIDMYDCYENYIKNGMCIVIDENIDAEKTIVVEDKECLSNTVDEYYSKYYLDDKKRYSDLIGEYHVKDKIDKKDFIAIGLPIISYINDGNKNIIYNNLINIQNILIQEQISIPIIDIDTFEIVDDNYIQNNFGNIVKAKSKIKRNINI